MAGETQDNVWPLPKFYFSVTFANGLTATFQEVTGLDNEGVTVDYRHGNSPSFYPIKMPGLGKVGNVTLRKGIFVQGSGLWDWLDQVKLGTIARQTVIVNLLDDTGAPKMMWTLNNAFPIKVTGTDLESEGNEVAVESVDIAFETMVIAAP
ncbi:phage tail protein [Sphingomonas sp. LB-2]|uniref:phage tail protein n=1 Tax=Sphingomonas caeni TaxID=2984949 RepID=UPI0022320978|nr:phage tail protein [Sphingomonas caeni]MCW3848976.1 phage tail protein [Sphingomonas caeni]